MKDIDDFEEDSKKIDLIEQSILEEFFRKNIEASIGLTALSQIIMKLASRQLSEEKFDEFLAHLKEGFLIYKSKYKDLDLT